MKSKKNYQKALGITSMVFACITSVALIMLLINIARLNILPTKYLILAILAITFILSVIVFLALFKKKELILKPISIVLSLLFSTISVLGFIKINDTIGFLSSNFGNRELTDNFSLIVSTNSSLNEKSDLSNYEIHAYRDLTLDEASIQTAVQKIFNATASFSDNLLNLLTTALDSKDYIIALNTGAYEALLDDSNIYKDRFKVIKTFDIVTKIDDASQIDITKTPFAIFLSGIDTRTGTLPSRSLSDVNIVAAVDPIKHKMLLVAIPRDYYVHLHGTPEYSLNDKLTHAGSTGGIELSRTTVEDLLGIEINYYIRVNFNFVQKLVDSIDGINIYSDVDYSFRGYNYPNCVFNPGYNYVYGECALAFSRERYAYSTGDRHRGENQEQVIGLILDKVSKSSTLLTHYSDILSSLDGTFETNLTMDNITTFFKKQLEDMPSWSISNQNLDGTGGHEPTYTYPNQELYIMYPDQASIDSAITKLHEMLGIENPEPTPAAVETDE